MMKSLISSNIGKALLISIVCIIAGIIGWGCILGLGALQTTDMSNIFNWGLLIGIFAFLVGFGAGSQFVASYMVITGHDTPETIAIAAQSVALSGAIGAAVAVVADLGHPLHIFSMLLTPNVASPLVWDMVALTLFIICAFIGLIALARDWNSKKVWMWICALVALGLQIIEGLLFSTQQARAWWHSFVMPIDFIAVAVVCGFALVCFMCAVSRAEGALDLGKKLARILFIAVIVHVVLSLCEIALLATEGTAGAQEALALVGSYIVLYLIEIGLSLGAAIALRVHDDGLTSKKLTVCSVLIMIAMFAHRLMLLYPAFGSSTLFIGLSNEASPEWSYPVSTGFLASAQESFALTQAYIPSFVEWVSILLPLGLTVAIAILGWHAADRYMTGTKQND